MQHCSSNEANRQQCTIQDACLLQGVSYKMYMSEFYLRTVTLDEIYFIQCVFKKLGHFRIFDNFSKYKRI